MTTTQQIILAIFGSTGFFSLVQFLIQRWDNKKNVKGRLNVLERDTLRTQLLLMILLKPTEVQEILTVGEHYFKDLHGNWYMTSIFNKWLTESDIAEPEWFNTKGKGE